MAARDEGLDKLEAFIAAAAEARASLQRGADTLEDLRSQVTRLEDDAEKRLQAFEDALEALARDTQPAVERVLPLILVVVVGTVLFGIPGGVAAALLVVAGQKYGPALQERLAELAEEWPALTDEISEDLLSTLEQETSEVTLAVREYTEAVEEEMEATAEEHDEVGEAFEEAEQVLEKGAEAAS